MPPLTPAGPLALPSSPLLATDRPLPSDTRTIAASLGNDGLSYLAVTQGSRLLFSEDGLAALSYVPMAGTALVLGAPAGEIASAPALIEHLLAVCRADALRPVLLGVPRWLAEEVESLGFHTLPVGDEAVVDPQTVDLRGRRWRDLRLALNRAYRKRVSFVWVPPAQRTHALLDNLHAVSRAWLSGKALPELRFAFGNLERIQDPAVRLGVAHSAEGAIEGFVTWVPVPGQRGWMLELLRGQTGAMSNRLAEFLVGSSLLQFQAEGCGYASLGGTPLANVDRRQWRGGRLLLGPLISLARPLYDFEGLRRFKHKFNPTWRPLYLAYRGRLGLPAAVAAATLACAPSLEPSILLKASWTALTGLISG